MNGIIIPNSYLKDLNNVDNLIDSLIKNFEPNESVSYSSFLNAVVQSNHADESLLFGIKEVKLCGLSTAPPNGLIFHRDNLLHYIIKIIKCGNDKATDKITGTTEKKNPQNYYKSLLLISSKLNRVEGNPTQALLKDSFIRTYPHYYLPKITYTIYSTRIQRYWYIYHDLLNSLEQKSRTIIERGIKGIEKNRGVSLDDYFYIINGIFNWFINVPLRKKENPDNQDIKKFGFDYKHLDTFYIDKSRFPGDDKMLKLIDSFSLDLNGFKDFFSSKKRKDEVRGFYKNFQDFFDHPVYKINDSNYCIIDLKFLFEGMCSGLIWHLNVDKDNLRNLKEQYGYLMEEYFSFLIKKVFPAVNLTRKEMGKPDAIIETEDSIIIFEFTTEYYRFASLYNTDLSYFQDDLYRMLFNGGKDDSLARGKGEEGKFNKLEKYINDQREKNKKIIPILITENNLGDCDLLDQFDSFIIKNIGEKNLENLKSTKPLILNLDDLETCWALLDPENPVNDFLKYVELWGKVKKGPYHYNFSAFISAESGGENKNKEYGTFFNYADFLGKIKM